MGVTPTRVREIFLAALEVENRVAFLDEACGCDAELRHRVEELLRSHEVAGDFLIPPDLPHESPEAATAEDPGTTIDRYQLIEPIGEGGFADIYLAEQSEPVRRQVALKIIKPGMDTRQVIARFEAERQALALMDHPGIAKVYDAGATQTGRPYFVMELVDGVPITEYCDQQRLTARNRLRLFIDVCKAVQHAHQKGIIHRDIKPANVLVTLQDSRPVPKIIDFGIAKATRQQLTEKTLFTEHGQLLGTPEYMSPEQAEFSPHRDVDTRSDIYSLGVLLYELLVGTPPFDAQDLRRRGPDELYRAIRESDPPTPSRRLSALGESTSDVVRHRQIQQHALWKLLRGDLDWIVMKCLEKDRSRRYETADALAKDVHRFLHNDPVEARPPTTSYRIQKFVRRNRVAVYAALALLLVLLLGSVSTTIGLLQARYQARRARVAVEQLTESVAQTTRQREAAEIERQRAERLRRQEQAARQSAERHRNLARENLYLAEMRLGSRYLAEGQLRPLHALLDRYLPGSNGPDLRSWEWYYFLAECHRDLFTLRGHTDLVCAVAWSPTRAQIASASRDGTVRIWDGATGQELRALHGHNAYVFSLAFSPDGERLASGGRYGRIRVWNPETGQRLLSIQHGDGYVRWLAWCLQGRRLASTGGGSDRKVRIWDSTTGEEMINFDDNNSTDPGSLLAVAVNREGNRLALGHEDGTIQILDVGAGQEVDSISGSPRIAWSMAWSPDGSRLAWGNSIWDVATGEKLTTLSQDATIDSLAWSPDGKLLTSGARDATRIWDAVTGHEVGMIGGHARSISWSATGQRLATSDGSAVKVWDMRHAEQPYLRHGTDVVTSIAWSRDGQHLASASLDNVVKIWEVSTGTETSVIREHAAVDSVCWSPDGRRLAVGCRDGSANIWDIARSSRLHSLSGPGREINTVAWSPHGKWLAAAGRPGLICIWDANTGQARHTVNGDERQVNSVAWNANGTHLATAGEASNRIKIWEPGTWQETHSIAGPLPGVPFSHLRAVAWSPDDARLLILADEKIGIWNAEKADIDFWISGHSGGNQAIAWSPDGRRFVSSGADRTVKIWHTVTGQEIISLVADTSDVRSLAWSPDGHQLALGGADGKIRIWDASQGFEFAESSDYRLDMAERAAVMSP